MGEDDRLLNESDLVADIRADDLACRSSDDEGTSADVFAMVVDDVGDGLVDCNDLYRSYVDIPPETLLLVPSIVVVVSTPPLKDEAAALDEDAPVDAP